MPPCLPVRPRILGAGALVAVAAAVGLLAPPAARADDSVDLQLAGSASVKGTIRSAEERESFLLDLPIGAKVTAVAKRSGKSAFVPYLDMVLDTDPVAGTLVSTKGTTTKLVSPPLTESGAYRVRVFGDGVADGDYQLKVTVKLQPKWNGTGVSSQSAFALTYAFGAPDGAQAKVTLKAANKKSGFVPALDGLIGPEGFSVPLAGTKTSYVPLGAGGSYLVGFHDGGSAGGAWKCSVALRIPKVRKSKIDISAGKLTGQFVDDQPVYGRLVDGDGGLVDPEALDGPLAGASVSIPGGALPFPVVITMAEGDDFELPGGAHPAGPVIQFGPPGTNFNGLEATVTMPYDTSAFGDPANDLTVYVLNESTGVVEPVLPRSSYDFSTPGVVSFPALHFSSYVAGGAVPRSIRGEWVVVQLNGFADFGFDGGAAVGVGSVQFEESAWNYSGRATSSLWFRDFQQSGPAAQTTTTTDTDFGFVEIGSDESVSLFSMQQEGNTPVFLRGPSSDVMYLNLDQQEDAEQTLLLRRVRGSPTATNLAGRWHLFFYSLGARAAEGPTSPPRLYTGCGRATATFGLDGTVSISSPSGREAETDFPDGVWQTKTAQVPAQGTFGLDGDVYMTIKDGADSQDFRLRPCLRGEVLAGMPLDSGGDGLLLLFVREATGQKANVFDAPTTVYGFASELVDVVDAAGAQGFDFTASEDKVQRSGSKGLQISPVFQAVYGHDTQGAPQVFVVPEAPPDTTTFSVSSNGAFKTANGFTGAIAPGGDFFFGVQPGPDEFALRFGTPGALVPSVRQR